MSTETHSEAAEAVFEAVESPAPSVTPPSQETNLFTQEDIARAREQEKAKLYPTIDQLKSEVAELRKDREERLEAERQAREEAERLEKERAESEMDVRQLLEAKEQEWAQRLEQERIERENAFALLEKERAYAQVQEYRNQRLAEVGDDILPELRDLVSGSTREEIDSSIAGLIDRSSRILEGAQSAMQAARQQMQGTRVTAPPSEMETNTGQQSFTPEEIAAMPMDEYAKYRSSLLGQGVGNQRGLFG